MKTEFSEDWKQWIHTNINAGRDKHGIFKILMDEGYSVDTIAQEMQFVPNIPLNLLTNPLQQAEQKRVHDANAPRVKVETGKELNQYIPSFHPTGFEKASMEPKLFERIADFYRQQKGRARDEHVPGGFIENQQKKKRGSVLVNLSDGLRQEIHDYMMPRLSEWCQKTLEPTFVYGIRTYLRGAKLKCHRDRIETHIISAIINVDQTVDTPWPLIIDDHNDVEHQVFLSPGEMVFYEGAKLRHGRPIAFDGSEFANIFCHFKPTDYRAPIAIE